MPLQEIPDFVNDGPAGKEFPQNLYWEPDSTTGAPMMTSTPGLVEAATSGSAAIHAMLSFRSVLYFVCGESLYSWTGTGAATLRGSGISTITNKISMSVNYDASSNYELATTDGYQKTIYSYNIGTTLFRTNIVPPVYPTNITYLKQVFVIGDRVGNRVHCSEIDNAISWPALYFSSKTAQPDRVKGVMAVNEDLWVFGETSSEIWYYTGSSSGLPFALMGGGVLDVGLASVQTLVTMDKSVYWLNNRGEVCRSVGYGYEVISPPYLNEIIQGYAASAITNITNAIGYSILWEGHPWYVLTLPGPEKTFVFDVVAKAAGQRGWFAWTSAALGRNYSNCAALLKGEWLTGSYSTNGKLYTLSNSTYTDDGSNSTRKKYGSTIFGGGERLRLNQFVAQGSFPATGSGYYLRLGGISDVDATSLTSPVTWSGLGSATSITPSLTYYGSGKAEIYKVYADISLGRRR